MFLSNVKLKDFVTTYDNRAQEHNSKEKGFLKYAVRYGGKVLGLGRFLLLTQLPLKMTLVSKAVKRDPKIIISLS